MEQWLSTIFTIIKHVFSRHGYPVNVWRWLIVHCSYDLLDKTTKLLVFVTTRAALWSELLYGDLLTGSDRPTRAVAMTCFNVG